MKKQNKTTPKKDGNTFKIFGIELISNSLEEVPGLVERRIAKGQKTLIVTPNTEFLVFSRKNPWFKRILMQSDIAIPDGIGLIWASRFLGRGVVKERVSGTDLMEKLCQMAAKKGWSIYLLGGKAGVADKALTILKQKYPGLKGWTEFRPQFEIRNSKLIGNWKFEIGKLVDRINDKKPTFLFVAFGMGKQEKFISDNWEKLNVRVAMGVGGAFDYLSGEVKRASLWIQKSGFEWLYRLARQPWRIRRQLSLGKFIFLVLKKKLSAFALHAQKP